MCRDLGRGQITQLYGGVTWQTYRRYLVHLGKTEFRDSFYKSNVILISCFLYIAGVDLDRFSLLETVQILSEI